MRDDLESAAMLGLTEAANRFDESRSAAFVAFASRRIRGAVLDELRRLDPRSRRTRAAVRKVEEATSTLRASFGRHPTDSELCEALEWTREELDCSRATTVSVQLFDDAAVDGAESPVSQVARRQINLKLAEALGALDERDRMILDLSFHAEISLREIGARLGVSESRICQLRGRAIERLRAKMSPELVRH